MAKRDFKAKLKAADRRRRKRAATVVAPSPPSHQASAVDVAGLVANVVLDTADDPGNDVRDKIVVSAFRATLKGLPASGDISGPLSKRLEALVNEDGVSRRGLRDALSSLLDMASEQQDPKDTQSFIRYLTLLAR
jgi:hypothetical protein